MSIHFDLQPFDRTMQVLGLEVGIDFGYFRGGMAKKFLHFVQGAPSLNWPSHEGAPQRLWKLELKSPIQ